MSTKRETAEAWRKARERALAAIDAMSDAEDAALRAAALGDPDNPPLGDLPPGRMRPASEVHPEFVKDWRRRQGERGPQKAPTKQPVSIRLDQDVLEHFRATGPGWQRRINAALRRAAKLPAGAKRPTKSGTIG